MNTIQAIHQKAINCARDFQKAEASLLSVIGEIDQKKIFRKLGYSSIFDYLTRSLKLSDSQASAFSSVARKSVQVPELKKAIDSGKLNVSKAKRICSVIEKNNHKEWIEKAATLSQNQVQREVARVAPQHSVPDRMKPITSDHTVIQFTATTRVENKFRRVKEVLSQLRKKPCTLEEALEAMADLFLEKNDPVLKAKRNSDKISTTSPNFSSLRKKKRPIPAPAKHITVEQSKGQCSHVYPDGSRCTAKTFLQIHHKIPLYQGGTHKVENLELLCFNHHKNKHDPDLARPQKSPNQHQTMVL